jgi:hypothetical protein
MTEQITKIKKLADIVRTNGRQMVLIWREGCLAIYRDSEHEIYELIVVRVGPPHPKDPNPEGYTDVESYPGSERWGARGWTYTRAAHQNPLKAAHEQASKLRESVRLRRWSAFY